MTDDKEGQNFSLTNEEIDFLLDILSNKKDNNKEEIETELTNFLTEQLQKIKNSRISKEEKDNKVNEVREENELILQHKEKKESSIDIIKKSLQKKIGAQVVLNLKAAKDCCSLAGVICKLGQDFVVILEQNYKIYIKLKAITSIQNKIKKYNKSKCNNYNDKITEVNNDQKESLDSKEDSSIDFNNGVECNKFEKSYVNSIE